MYTNIYIHDHPVNMETSIVMFVRVFAKTPTHGHGKGHGHTDKVIQTDRPRGEYGNMSRDLEIAPQASGIRHHSALHPHL